MAAGSGEILIKSFAGLAFNTVVTASSDDFSGKKVTGPTVPEQYRKHKKIEEIVVGRNVLIGTSCVILPGVETVMDLSSELKLGVEKLRRLGNIYWRAS